MRKSELIWKAMSDQEGDDPETGAGGEGNTPATDPNNNSDNVGNDGPTTPHMGDRSDGGEFESPNTEGDTGRARVPSERVSAGSEDSISEQDLTESSGEWGHSQTPHISPALKELKAKSKANPEHGPTS